jgi:hypothetical protein
MTSPLCRIIYVVRNQALAHKGFEVAPTIQLMASKVFRPRESLSTAFG